MAKKKSAASGSKGPSKETLARINKFKSTWKTARTAKPGEYNVPKIKAGTYDVKVTAKYGLSSGKKQLYASITWTILKGKYKGKSSNAFFGLENPKNKEREEGAWKGLAIAVQTIMGVDTSGEEFKNDPAALFKLLEGMNKKKPTVRAKLSPGRAESGTEYINCRFLDEEADGDDDDEEEDDDEEGDEDESDDDDESEEEDDEEEDDDDDEESDDEEEEDDDEESDDEEEEDDDEEEEEEAEAPEKGAPCRFKPPKGKGLVACEVITVNKKQETCTVKEKKTGKQHKSISWDKLKF